MDPTLLLNQPVGSRAADCLSGMLSQSCSENNLKFVCEFKPGEEDYNVDMDFGSVSVVLPAQCSVHQLRLRICMQVGKPLGRTGVLLFRSVFEICIVLCSLSEVKPSDDCFQYTHHLPAHNFCSVNITDIYFHIPG